ncbi:MAG TPA: outer membrane beta-barrel protein [Saprospiraceae bacterium]|nr:outer membrane beta-barrel protein [Saprospiraceae bacterium]
MFCILLLAKFSSFAQKTTVRLHSGPNFYFKEGKVIHNADTFLLDSESGRIGFQVGYGVEFYFNKKCSILLGLEFSKRSVDETIARNLFETYESMYMSFPASLHYEFLPKFKAGFGVQYDYLVHKRPGTYVDFEKEKSWLRNYDIGLTAGLRYRIGHFELDVSGVYGLLYIVNTMDDSSASFKETSKARLFKFGIAWLID